VEDEAARLRKRSRSLLNGALSRAERYLDIIEKELERERVPADLAFLPLVESGFRPDVYGLGGAGLWQLSGHTARRYGLSVARRGDERRDPVKSSRAAARYLRDLFDEFGEWDLALAAYNAGPGRVKQALARMPKATFWELADRRLLPSITRDFVPQVLACGVVGRQLVS
jgi:membrane-bound lytic murein transglycosylase D